MGNETKNIALIESKNKNLRDNYEREAFNFFDRCSSCKNKYVSKNSEPCKSCIHSHLNKQE